MKYWGKDYDLTVYLDKLTDEVLIAYSKNASSKVELDGDMMSPQDDDEAAIDSLFSSLNGKVEGFPEDTVEVKRQKILKIAIPSAIRTRVLSLRLKTELEYKDNSAVIVFNSQPNGIDIEHVFEFQEPTANQYREAQNIGKKIKLDGKSANPVLYLPVNWSAWAKLFDEMKPEYTGYKYKSGIPVHHKAIAAATFFEAIFADSRGK